MPHFEWIHLICAGAVAAAALLVVLHILFTMRDDSERASMWIILVLCLPVAGIVLYLLAGITRRNTLGKRISHAVEEFLRSRDEAEHRGLKEYRGAMERFVSDGGSRESTMSHRRMLDALIRASLEDPASASMIPGTIPLSGNRLELLCDGSAAYPAMIESIRAARHNINMQTFIFADDRFGRIMMGELRKKALEGVQVRVICDRFGSFKSLFSLFFLPYLKRTPNLHVIPFSNTSLLTPWRIQLRNHRKLLVVDGRTAFIGGLNISEDNFKWFARPDIEIHDFHCRLTGPAVGELQYAFLCDWFYASRDRNVATLFTREFFPVPEACGESVVRTVPSGHGYLFEGSEKVFFTAASTARKSIWIISPYFAPSKDFSKALRMASARGVDVRVIVPRNNNHWYVKMAARSFYESLIGNGVRVFERLGTFTHAKAMLVDGEWAYFGSSNCDIRSFRLNYELDLLISHGDFPEALHRQFLEELKNSAEITSCDLASRSAPRKLLESVCALMTPVL